MSLDRVIKKVRDNDVIIWAGSGLSLYSGMPSSQDITNIIMKSCTEEEKEGFENINSLSSVTSDFVQMRNGSRNDLYRLLRNAFDIEIKTNKFHQLLSEIPQINTLITTNYDKLFESAYGNDLDVITNDEDISLINKKRVLYKIHGDIDNFKQILITDEDYTDFFRNQDKPIWNKVKSLLAEKTVIFLGYSLEDQNIKYLIDNIFNVMGSFKKESFIVTPSLQPHREKLFNKSGVTHIKMTGEDFIAHIHTKIKRNLLIDVEKGRLQPELVVNSIKKDGIKPEFILNEKGAKLSSIGADDNDSKINLNIKFTGVDFWGLYKEANYNVFKISGENIESLNSNIGGIDLPNFENVEAMYVKPLPTHKDIVDIYFKDKEKQLLNVKLESYAGNGRCLTRFIHSNIEFEINYSEDKFTYKFKKMNSLQTLREILTFMRILISGEQQLYCYLHSKDKEINFIQFDKYENESILKKIDRELIIINKLGTIQNKYGIRFKNFIFDLSVEDLFIIDIVWNSLMGEKVKLHPKHLNMSFKKADSINGILEEDETYFIKINGYLETIEVLQHTIKIGKYRVLECTDAYVGNKSEVLKSIELNDEEINIVIKSKQAGFNVYLEDSNIT